MKNKELEGITVVFDIDDTICNNKNRDYENAVPFTDVIGKINDLHQKGCKIVLFTSRGMKSCEGNIEKIIEKNKAILETWLEKNGVQYDELHFGKPLGDMYVDDKGISKNDFLNTEVKVMSGHSGYTVTRIGNIVKKEMSEDNYKKLTDWYEHSKGIVKSPERISNLYNAMYIEYIDGKTAADELNEDIFRKILDTVDKFKEQKLDSFNKEKVYSKLDSHKSKSDKDWNAKIEAYKEIFNNIDFTNFVSLSHSDFTLSNIMIKDNELYLIDSIFDKEVSSYLFDYAKLKMSLDGYDELFCNKPKVDSKYKEMLDDELKKQGVYDIVNILEIIYAIRLYRYNDDKDKVKMFVSKLEEMYV